MIKFLTNTALCFLLIGVVIPVAKAQQLSGTVSGLILEKGTGNRLADVNVVNLRTYQRVKTSVYGVFYIEASIGDSLSISKTGYGPLKTILYTTEDILLEMQAGLQIETVVVSRRTRQQEMDDILRDYEKKGIYNGGKNKVGTYLNSPATALYNLFGREAKNMKRFEKFMNREMEEMTVDKIFSKSVVGQATGLEGEELQNFMDMYRPSYEQAQKWGQYDVLDYISRSFKTWDEEGRPAPQKLPKLEIPLQEK